MTVSSQVIPAATTSAPGAPAPGPGPSAPLGLFDRLAPRLHQYGLGALRAGLGGVFVWFGVLKVIGLSPAAALVVAVVPFPAGSWFVPALGWGEVALGLWLVSGRARAVALPVLAAHLCGTFAVLVLTPSVAFAHANPLLLTLVGEFVVKNVVLLAGVVVVTTRPGRPTRPVRPTRPGRPAAPRELPERS
ncbi:DoxX family protein [Streptomyces sp. NPDC002773]|uniref:DoxX family protein n=1 Tax=Streptomyces sp. NPDC002773 TaxID=3154430 RepID=UPI003326F70A